MNFKQFVSKLTIAAIAAALLIPLSLSAAEPTAESKVADINGKTIYYNDYKIQMEMFKQQAMQGKPGQLPEALHQRLKEQVIRKMVADELLVQEGIKQGVQVDPGIIENEVMKIKTQFKDEQQFKERLKTSGLTEEKLSDQIRRRMIISELIKKTIVPQIKVSKEDARKFYDENPEKFRRPEKVRARHILIKIEKGDSKEKKEAARKKLKDLQRRILNGEDFSALAKEHSQGPSSVKGGDLGYFTEGRMVKPFEEVAFKLAPNEVSDIVETQFGYHLIKVEDHQPESSSSYEENENKIMSFLFNTQIQKKLEPYVLSLREKADIKIYIK